MNADVIIYRESIGYNPAVSPSGLSEAEDRRIARLRRGEESAFVELVDQHHSVLLRIAMGYVADREVAEEVVQDTWMAVIESLNRFEGRSSLRTWICGILIHKAKDRGVREKRYTTFSTFESYDDEHEEAVDPSRFQQSGDWAGHWAFPPQP
jgi:RNA polymerase sigma-70 factor (ECF subfamily)